jgi:carbamoyl-phosphate synthase large subunit
LGEIRTKVILLGSGGLSIGQAGEFDYSGTQALRSLIEEGFHVIVINPNIATVQTNPQENVTVYLYPVQAHWVEKVIAKEMPQAIVGGFGGQTALQCLIDLSDSGVLEKYNVTNFGTDPSVLKLTEDRQLFAKHMVSIDIPIPPSLAAHNVEEAIQAAKEIGFPVILRAAYALGGLGSGFAYNKEDLIDLAKPALLHSPQVLIEKSLLGWKEIEYEVMRDSFGNSITICNMENFDPLGVHTGDSIVVCPSQSLSDEEYQTLRSASLKIVNSLGIVGECNVQLTLDPESLQYYVIEVNARLSRSSALASKASGYPIAAIAAKVVTGKSLLDIVNPVTGVTKAFFEPALDYIVMKVPKWDLQKFRGVSRSLGSTMKSVGEVMAIGRSYPEVLQKAFRMVYESPLGLSLHQNYATEDLQNPTDDRIFKIYSAFKNGQSLDEVHRKTKIDSWFLFQLQNIAQAELSICHKNLADLSKVELLSWKRLGFADAQIAQALQVDEMEVRKKRLELDIRPVAKRIDTTAGEYPANTNYLYVSYHGTFSDERSDDERQNAALLLGGGPYRIGASVEFDWCAVSCSQELRETGWRSIIINCNPETVSTDYNASDRLYFEELSKERVMDIAEFEECPTIIACMGGQLPNKLAQELRDTNLKIIGHSQKSIDTAEDREKFSALLDSLDIDQPKWVQASSKDEVKSFIDEIGYPVIVRPSYVLSGAAMAVATDDESLYNCLRRATVVSKDHPIVVSEFIEDAREIELDGVAQRGRILTSVVSEHIENAGIHSGDATTVVPAQNLYVETVRKVRKAAQLICEALELNGPFNIQFLAKRNQIKVIECNARAARSFPFVSKVIRMNLAKLATQVMINKDPQMLRLQEDHLPYVGVKAAMFSFKRLLGSDPISGVEMTSTGEVGCLGTNVHEALLLALEASHLLVPRKGILVSSGKESTKLKFLIAAEIIQEMGIPIFASQGTAKHLKEHGFKVTELAWSSTSSEELDVFKVIEKGLVDCVINIPKSLQSDEIDIGTKIRTCAIQHGCSVLSNMEKVVAFFEALENSPDFINNHNLISLPEYL